MTSAIFCLRAMILVQTGHVVDNLISYWELVDKKEPINFLNNFLFGLRGIADGFQDWRHPFSNSNSVTVLSKNV